jgi:hypothetical protein
VRYDAGELSRDTATAVGPTHSAVGPTQRHSVGPTRSPGAQFLRTYVRLLWSSKANINLGIAALRPSYKFESALVRFRYSLPGCLPPCTDQTGILPQPPGTFTSRLSTHRSPSTLLDMTTTATGLLCWRDSHPLEWQLASLHGHFRPARPIVHCSSCPLRSKNGPECSARHAKAHSAGVTQLVVGSSALS